jgi:hypothetical protein
MSSVDYSGVTMLDCTGQYTDRAVRHWKEATCVVLVVNCVQYPLSYLFVCLFACFLSWLLAIFQISPVEVDW